MEKVVHKFHSFKEQEEFEKNYWLKASPQEKFNAIETIRAIYISTFHPTVKKISKVVKKRKLNDNLNYSKSVFEKGSKINNRLEEAEAGE